MIDCLLVASFLLMNLSIILILFRMYKIEKRQDKQEDKQTIMMVHFIGPLYSKVFNLEEKEKE